MIEKSLYQSTAMEHDQCKLYIYERVLLRPPTMVETAKEREFDCEDEGSAQMTEETSHNGHEYTCE